MKCWGGGGWGEVRGELGTRGGTQELNGYPLPNGCAEPKR